MRISEISDPQKRTDDDPYPTARRVNVRSPDREHRPRSEGSILTRMTDETTGVEGRAAVAGDHLAVVETQHARIIAGMGQVAGKAGDGILTRGNIGAGRGRQGLTTDRRSDVVGGVVVVFPFILDHDVGRMAQEGRGDVGSDTVESGTGSRRGGQSMKIGMAGAAEVADRPGGRTNVIIPGVTTGARTGPGPPRTEVVDARAASNR